MKRIKNAPKYKDNIVRSPSVPERFPSITLVNGDGGLYLVNESSEILEFVSSKPLGANQDAKTLTYEDVEPNEGVLIYINMTREEFDALPYYPEGETTLYIYLKSKRFGYIELIAPYGEQKLICSFGAPYRKVTMSSLKEGEDA